MENRRDETPFFYNTARSPTQTPCTLYSLTPRYYYLFSPLIPGTRLQFHTDSPLLLVVFFIDRTRVFFDSKSDFFNFFFLGWIFLGWLLSQCSTDVTVLDCDSSACGDRSHGNFFFSFFLLVFHWFQWNCVNVCILLSSVLFIGILREHSETN